MGGGVSRIICRIFCAFQPYPHTASQIVVRLGLAFFCSLKERLAVSSHMGDGQVERVIVGPYCKASYKDQILNYARFCIPDISFPY